jgi:predicted RND superfamily exporter protein
MCNYMQSSLLSETVSSVALAAVAAILALLASTRNPWLSLVAALAVTAAIAVTLATLVLALGWQLNVLEAVATTLAVGISVDFVLHYGVAFAQKARTNIETNIDIVVHLLIPVNFSSFAQGCAFSCLSSTCSSVSMAALTTFVTGLALIPARVVVYVHIGAFIAVVAAASWIYATFFFVAALHVLKPVVTCNALNCTKAIDCVHSTSEADYKVGLANVACSKE